MRIDYWIPAIGQNEMLQSCVDELRLNQQHGDTEIHVIDNGSIPPLIVKDAIMHREEDNLGMIESLARAMELSHSEILCYAHSDFFIHEFGWDSKIVQAFTKDPKLGLVGTVGARVAESDGGRSEVICSFRDGSAHGTPTPPGIHSVAILDGCAMFFRRSELDRIGIDRGFQIHHFYDKAFSLEFTLRGSRVGVIQLDCDHRGGQTSCRPDYQKWASLRTGSDDGDLAIYRDSERRYLEKYRRDLPVRVTPDWKVKRRAK